MRATMLTRVFAVTALVLVAAAVCPPTGDAAERERIRPSRLYQRGATAFGEGLYAVAAADFADYLATYPTRRHAAQVALLLAESNVYLGRHAAAAEALDWLEASRWAGRYEPELAYWRAQLALRTGQADEALAAFTAFLKEYPKHERVAYARLGVAQAQLARG
jgi:outer membrane protein assembly factor BamD (BamD/ComL family)